MIARDAWGEGVRPRAVRGDRVHRRADRRLPGRQRARRPALGAGRAQPRKLEAVAARLAAANPEAPVPALLEADAADAAALAKVAESTRVVITTVGPYALYGAPLVAACAAAGTDYVDLTGEPEFVDRMYLENHAAAERSGARLVHCCGFDSVPHDLGAYFTCCSCPRACRCGSTATCAATRSFSGGTYHSAVNGFARGRQTIAAAQDAQGRRAAPGRPQDPLLPRADPPRRGARRLDRAAADDRRADRPPLRRRGRPLRPRLHLRPPRRRPPPRHGRRDGRRDRRGRRPRPDPADPQAPAEGESRPATGRARRPAPAAGSRSASSARAAASASSPRSPAATRATRRRRRSSPSAASASPSTTSPTRAGQLTTVASMGDMLLTRLQSAGIAFRVLESA